MTRAQLIEYSRGMAANSLSYEARLLVMEADEIELLETERDEAWAECDRLRDEVERLRGHESYLDPQPSVTASRERLYSLTRDGDIGAARRALDT